ncbi:MAG: RNA polymerase subunit sigma [Clostridiales bacterium]
MKKIAKGDTRLKNKFINDYKPFIVKCVLNSTRTKYVNIQDSDEYSIGLIAFNEAIECFNIKKGINFFDFAKLIITRRLIRHNINNRKYNNEVPFSYFDENKNKDIELKLYDIDLTDTSIELKNELLDFKNSLEIFGITISELVDISPKRKDSINSCISCARILAQNTQLYSSLINRKQIPIIELRKLSGLNRRTIERNRKFIISTALILNSDLIILKEFIKGKGDS